MTFNQRILAVLIALLFSLPLVAEGRVPPGGHHPGPPGGAATSATTTTTYARDALSLVGQVSGFIA